jgi:hypothetical protein
MDIAKLDILGRAETGRRTPRPTDSSAAALAPLPASRVQ